MALSRYSSVAIVLALFGAFIAAPTRGAAQGLSLVQAGSDASSVGTPPGPFKPTLEPPSSDIWIFSGTLQNSHEAFSGTLVATDGNTDFELKLARGATCDGGGLWGRTGLVELTEITCTDERTMRVLFVPENGRDLQVFGHVGEDRFVADAHLLGTEPPRERERHAVPQTLKIRPGGPDAPQRGGAAGQNQQR